MAETITTTAPATVTPETNGTPKATTKKAAKPKAKAAKKPAAKATPAKAAPAKTNGLRKPQVRILACLAKSNKPLSRIQIAEKAPVDQAACVEYLGSHDPEVRKANDKKHFPSLVTLGYVKNEEHDIDGRNVVVYSITAKGRAEYAKAK